MLADAATQRALPAFAPWDESLKRAITGASSASSAEPRLAAWAESHADDPEVARSIYESTLKAAMAGALHLRTVEVPEALPRRASRRRSLALGDTQGMEFMRLPFDEAIADFLARGVVTPAQWRRMSDAARARSFTATQLASDALRQRAYDAITSALENGDSYREFARTIERGERTLGITPSDPAYVENVFRTNIASAYSAGRYQQMQHPAVLAARPFVQFRAIVDDRTTTRCRYCNGLTFNRQTDPGWVRYNPPLHFQCRSVVAVLGASSVSASQVIHSSRVDPRGDPMEGFGGAHGLDL